MTTTKKYTSLCILNLFSTTHYLSGPEHEGEVDKSGEAQFRAELYAYLGLNETTDSISEVNTCEWDGFDLEDVLYTLVSGEEDEYVDISKETPSLEILHDRIKANKLNFQTGTVDGMSWVPDLNAQCLVLKIETVEPVTMSTKAAYYDHESRIFQALNNQLIESEYYDEERRLDNEVFAIHLLHCPLPECDSNGAIDLHDFWQGFEAFFKPYCAEGEDHPMAYFDYNAISYALRFIKELLNRRMVDRLYVALRTDDNAVGALVLTQECSKLYISQYELTWSDHGNMATSAHHTVGQEILSLFPEIKVFGPTREDSYFLLGLHNDKVEGDAGPFIPAILNGFIETMKHCGFDLPQIKPDDKPLFEHLSGELVQAGVSRVIVDDFLEIHGDLTSVMLVSFYKGESLILELSYSLALGVPSDGEETLKEIQFDDVIETFCKTHGLAHNRVEHMINHPTCARELSHFQSDNALKPSSPRVMRMNNAFAFQACLTVDEEIDPTKLTEQDIETLHNYASRLLRNNLHERGKEPEPFKFVLARVSDGVIDDDAIQEILHLYLIGHIEPTHKVQYPFQLKATVGQKSNVLHLFGIHDLEGKARDETYAMLQNMAVIYQPDGEQTTSMFPFVDDNMKVSLSSGKVIHSEFGYRLVSG